MYVLYVNRVTVEFNINMKNTYELNKWQEMTKSKYILTKKKTLDLPDLW